jgi:hypothetical protein
MLRIFYDVATEIDIYEIMAFSTHAALNYSNVLTLLNSCYNFLDNVILLGYTNL